MRLPQLSTCKRHVANHRNRRSRVWLLVLLISTVLLSLFGCAEAKTEPPAAQSRPVIDTVPVELKDSWDVYVAKFIQKDGRVIDYKASGVTTSEGQAYAMLRAVWVGDRTTFDRTFLWAKNNLNSGIRNDSLWAWKWGEGSDKRWRVLDEAFATDADQDAALALILASIVWNNRNYAEHAHLMLRDLWSQATVEAGGHRYLLAGDSLCQRNVCRINPSYYAPYAYRIFGSFDKSRPWSSLVDSSYTVLQIVSGFADTKLPADWVQLNRANGQITAGTLKDSKFSYDAFRVYWRVALDRDLFQEARAAVYLDQTLKWLSSAWAKDHKLAASISKTGKPLVDYESLEMLAGLAPALRDQSMFKRIESSYSNGIWGDKDSYYLQNWAWFGTALYRGYLGPFALVRSR